MSLLVWDAVVLKMHFLSIGCESYPLLLSCKRNATDGAVGLLAKAGASGPLPTGKVASCGQGVMSMGKMRLAQGTMLSRSNSRSWVDTTRAATVVPFHSC